VHGWSGGGRNPRGRCINPNPARRMRYRASDRGDRGITSSCEDEHQHCRNLGIYVGYEVWDRDRS
jgi:hypothetical protein